MDQSMVQRAVMRLRDNIARREATEDVEALKVVLLEMSAQKKRADQLERELTNTEQEVRDCIALNAEYKAKAQRRKEKLIQALHGAAALLSWVTHNDGECIGDHPLQLAIAKQVAAACHDALAEQ